MFTIPTTTDKVNEVVINGQKIGMVTDQEALYIYQLITGQTQPVSKPVSTTLSIPEEKSPKQVEIPGNKVYTSDFVSVTDVDGQMRVYITCPIGGEKGKKIRYAIKASAKEFGATFAGNYDEGDIFWAFKTKKDAQAFIKARKEYDKKSA